MTDGKVATHISRGAPYNRRMECVAGKGTANKGVRASLSRLLCGLLIGVACVMPGVSGGVLAAGFGLYLPMLDAVTHLFRTPRKSMQLLLPLGAGILTGVFLGAALMSAVLDRWYTPCVLLFLGMVLGGVPSLVRDANRSGFRGSYAAALLLGAAAASFLLLWRTDGAVQADALAWWQALLAGGVAACGTVIPGVSMTCILLLLGWYAPLLQAVAGPEHATLTLALMGALAAGIPLIFAVRHVFVRFYGQASYAVLGFLLVTVGLSFPLPLSGVKEQAALLLLPVGFCITWGLSRITGRVETSV